MFHLLFRCTLFMIGGFCAALAVLRAWPYEDHDLDRLIASDDCTAPCFMGIQPGVTTPDEAVALLENHEWVASDSIRRTSGGEVMWTWNGQQPAVINPSEPPLLIVWAATREMQVVNGIQLPLVVPVGHAFLELGEPPILGVGERNSNRDRALIIAIYDHYALEVWSDVACPITRRKFLEAPLNLFWLTMSDIVTPAQPASANLVC